MNRLQEIEARLAAIANEIEQRGAELTAEQLTAFETEVNNLKTERAGLMAAAEQRNNLLNSIAEGRSGGAVVRTFPSPSSPAGGEQRNEADPLDSMEYRRAFMAYALRGTPIPAEFRTDAVSKTADNGAVIPTTILNRIVEKMEAVGMILPLVTRTAYKGGVSIPTSSAKPVASWVAEGAGSDKQKKTTGSIPAGGLPPQITINAMTKAKSVLPDIITLRTSPLKAVHTLPSSRPPTMNPIGIADKSFEA